jgi:GNAT superfamily N-acetyltransferase
MFTYSPVKFNEQSLHRYESLFYTCFLKSRKFEPITLNWLYVENPDGLAVGFDAFDGETLAAHYVCIPATLRVNGKLEKALLSLNTATHPQYQKKGLFTKLAEMTYQAAADLGFCTVYGVANANSTPGFVRKLGFQLVQPLNAKIGFGSLGIDFSMASSNAQFERVWTQESLMWRCSSPVNPILSFRKPDRIGFQASAFGKILSAYAELPGSVRYQGGDKGMASPFRLFLGLVPGRACSFTGYTNIPQRLRPAPLNVIFRSLTQSAARLEAGHIAFSFLDFDAY